MPRRDRGRGYFNRGRGFRRNMGDVKGASRLACHDFNSEKDNFASWVTYFEKAVSLAHSVTDPEELHKLCLTWIGLSLDKNAKAVLNQVVPEDPANPTWEETKTQLASLLINPHEKYNWRTGKTTIMWDGKESFHSLATRVQECVDMYDPNCSKVQEYFCRFRRALPPDFQNAIDVGCKDETEETIEEAKRIAYRFLNIHQRNQVAGLGLTAVGEKPVAVSFTGAAMSDDRLKAMELSQQSILVALENLKSKQEKSEEDRRRGSSSSRERQDGRNPHHRSPSRGGEGRYDDRRGRGRNSRRDDHDGRSSYRNYRGSPERRRDDYNRRNSDYRSNSRYGRDSYDRRDSSRYRDPSRYRDGYSRDSSRYRDGYSRDSSRYRDGYSRDSSRYRDGYSRDSSRRRDGYSRDRDDRGYDRRGESNRRDRPYSRGRSESYGRGRSHGFSRDESGRREDSRRRDADGRRGGRDGSDRSRDRRDGRRSDSRDDRDNRRNDRRDDRREDRGDRRDSGRQGDRSSGDKQEHKLANFDLGELSDQLGKLCGAMGINEKSARKQENE